jgi:thioredoxin-like negative regulator of GroEL
MLSLLLSFGSSALVTLTTTDAARSLFGSEDILFVFFSGSHCEDCAKSYSEFEKASTFFDEPTFASIDCSALSDFCREYRVNRFPFICLLFTVPDTRTEFQDFKSADRFADFIEVELNITANRSGPVVRTLTPAGFVETISEKSCSLIYFYQPGCRKCGRALPEVMKVGETYATESRALVGLMNCVAHLDFCEGEGVESFPQIRLYKGNESKVDYQGIKGRYQIVEFVNQECGLDAQVLLNDTAGLLKGRAEEIVKEFKAGRDREKLIEEMKGIAGGELYVEAMELIVEDGDEELTSQLIAMERALHKETGTDEELVAIKLKHNVFSLFKEKKGDAGL